MYKFPEIEILFISGFLLICYFYFPLYIKKRLSLIHLIKSLLLPLAGCVVLVSVFFNQWDYICSRILGFIWLYSVLGTSLYKFRSEFKLTYYNSIFVLYQTGMLIFASTLIMDGYEIDKYGVHVSNVMKVGAAIYLLKLLNTKDFVSRHKNMPLIIISFFTPVLSVMLFLFF